MGASPQANAGLAARFNQRFPAALGGLDLRRRWLSADPRLPPQRRATDELAAAGVQLHQQRNPW